MTLLTGARLSQGHRTVTAALRSTGTSRQATGAPDERCSIEHDGLLTVVSRQLPLLIVETFVPAGASMDLVFDETLGRRWGSKIEPPRPLPR